MAAAHSAMINGGYSVVPHTIQRIEFNDGSEPYEPEYPSVSVISEASAYLSTYCMENDVSGHYGNYMDILDNNNYEVYAKTGTSNHDDSFIELGIPAGVAKDRWMIASTSEITTAVWLGYDSVVDGNCYFDGPKSWINMPGKINKEILNTYYSYHPYPKNVEKPESVQSITHLKGVYPYAAVDETTPEELVVTGLINKKFNTLEETPEITIETLKNVNVVESSVDGNKLTVTVKFDRYPTNYELQEDGTFLYTLEYERKPEEGETPEEGKDTITVYRKVNLNKFYDPQLIKGPIRYVVALNDEIIATSDKNEFTFEYDINYSIKDVTFSCYYKYRDDEMTSNFDEITIDLSNYSFEVNISSLNTIAKVSSLMNQLDLNWTLESIPLTKTAVENGHSSGEVISIKGSDYSKDLREETITEKLSDIKNVVVQYYNEISISFDSDYSTLLDTYELYKQYLNNITIVYVPTLDVEQNHKIVSISNEIPEDTSIYELTTLGNIEITVYQYTE